MSRFILTNQALPEYLACDVVVIHCTVCEHTMRATAQTVTEPSTAQLSLKVSKHVKLPLLWSDWTAGCLIRFNRLHHGRALFCIDAWCDIIGYSLVDFTMIR